ncbi:N-acetylmuramidase domain-containing protein [Pararhizobium haloflavum]|uniref:N-acetylmuramidase domain-containing protein n=1 Tax=Pararhizobium haloflavum TaxID=2037914 RepID=UPI000C1771B1|nr:N-acetylmuramidase domain-containing protein [Pararhizobium haloflavum]
MTDWTSFRGAAARLDDIDLPRIGHRIGVGEDELHAFMDVEAAGSGFDGQGRPKMLFEPHVFYRNLSGDKRDQAERAGLAYRSWGTRPYPADSYPRLIEAMAIDETAALKSASWGLAQILGENHAMVGYETPQAMVRAFMEDEEHHLEAMVQYLIVASIADDLRGHRWEAVARGYNGPGYAKHNYHGRMAAAFAKWQRIPDTPWQPPAGDLPSIPDRMVSRGMRGASVRALQTLLARLGHYGGAVDGVFGPMTEAAVRDLQREAGILVDGYAGPQTFAAIEAALAPSSSSIKEAAMAATARSSPMDQVSKAKGAGKGIAKGAGFSGAVVTLLLAFDVLPPELNTAEVGAAIGVLITGTAAFIMGVVDSYRAPKNAD